MPEQSSEDGMRLPMWRGITNGHTRNPLTQRNAFSFVNVILHVYIHVPDDPLSVQLGNFTTAG